MESKPERAPRRRALTLASAVAAALVALLVALYALTAANMATIDEQVEAMSSRIYPVTTSAGRVETLLVRLGTLSAQPLYVRTGLASDDLEASYDRADANLRQELALIAERYPGDAADVQALEDSYDQLVDAQDRYLAVVLDPATGDEEVAAFLEREVAPLLAQSLQANTAILDGSQAAFDEVYAAAERVRTETMVAMTAIMVAVAAALVMYMRLLARERRRQEKLQESLEDALELARTASEAKSQFLSSMSHDIRTPMNAITGLTAIAQAHVREPHRVATCLEKIASSSRHLLGLVNDVLDMNKIESGKITLDEQGFNFPELIGTLVPLVQSQARDKQLALDVVIGNVERELVVGDPMRLTQVLLNLVGNAVKYTPAGGSVRLAVTEEPSRDPSRGRYRFVVSDTGVGMSPEFLDRLFDPFERERTDTVSQTEGTGLGMAIAKNIVDLMGGTIDVESEVGVGTTFTVVLPLRFQADAAAADPQALAGLRVLAVDDDRDVRESTVLMLSQLGAVGVGAASGADALARTEEAHEAGADFDAMIVDWVMPGMDGVETVRRIRGTVGGEVPIILLTAYDWTEVEAEATEAGVNAFLSKPLYQSKLRAVLGGLCSKAVDDEGAPEPSGARPPLAGRVLLAEDNELNREIAVELIGMLGPEVVCACDGVEACEAMRAAEPGTYDLILMDMQMPRRDGIDATRLIIAEAKRAGRPRPPIVAMTANAFNEDRDRALAAGMAGFMTKPIDLKELERQLRTYLPEGE